jgi:hypothetical protein
MEDFFSTCGGLFLTSAPLAALHGALMVSGFFGTVIALERAVALGHRWAYLGLLSGGLGGFALIAGAPPIAGQTTHMENDEPQPQVEAAAGFLITNCAPSRSSL